MESAQRTKDGTFIPRKWALEVRIKNPKFSSKIPIEELRELERQYEREYPKSKGPNLPRHIQSNR